MMVNDLGNRAAAPQDCGGRQRPRVIISEDIQTCRLKNLVKRGVHRDHIQVPQASNHTISHAFQVDLPNGWTSS